MDFLYVLDTVDLYGHNFFHKWLIILLYHITTVFQ